MRSVFFLVFFILVGSLAICQPVQSNFSIQSNGCLQENILASNLSTNADRYEWDVCQGDLGMTPTGSLLTNISGTVIPTGLDFTFDGTGTFALVASRDNNSIYRLSLDATISSVTATTNLGNVGSLLNRPVDVKIATAGGNWYAFVFNEGTNMICRLDFGNSLANAPTATVVLTTAAPGSNQGFDMIRSGTVWYIAYTYNSKVGIVRLSSITSIPTAGDQMITSDLTGSPTLGDIKLMEQSGSFFAYAPAYSSVKLYRLAFGTNPLSIPVETDISSGLPGGLFYFGIDGGYDAGHYYLFMSTLNGNFVRADLGADLTQLPSSYQSLGDLGILTNTLKHRLIRSGTTWISLSVDFNTGNLFKTLFPSPICDVVPGLVTTSNPIFKYTAAGTKYITLTAFQGGQYNEKSKSIAISGSVAPAFDFTNQNVCALNPVNFTSQPGAALTTIQWDFGNATTSSQPNPSTSYSSSGAYDVTAAVQFGNGCGNFARKTINIYNAPVANFALPAVTPVCSNQDYLLTNSSTFDPGSNPSWEWRINGVLLSTSQNFAARFTSTISQDVRLKAKIPGCENEISRVESILTDGPAIDFTYDNKCFGAPTNFSNTTVGTVDQGYAWTFGDAATSTQPSPSHSYAAIGPYQVTLTGNNSNGCNNFMTKTIQIYSVPQPDFSIGAPPFSCANTPAPFQNLTPPLTDSNITGWSWQFNDAAGGTANQQNPSYVFPSAGTYSVMLTATSDAGCSKSVTKPSTISSSPVADFTISPSCLNLPTKFTDLSSGSIQSRNWQIGPASFTSQNPSYTFTSTGNFSAVLTVTSANGCSSVKTRPVTVPVPPILNFNSNNLCARKDAIFTDVTSSPQDVVSGWNWNFDGNAATGNPATFSFATTGTFNVKLTTTHLSGCKYTLSRNVAINPSPLASFIASPDRGEPPLTVKFTNTSQQAVSYAWKFYDKVVSTSTSTSPVYTFIALGDYSAELTATNGSGCSDVIAMPIKVLVPSIDLVLSQFSLVNDPVTAKLKAVVTILNNGNVPVNFADVSLILSDKAVVNETVQIDLNPGTSVTKTLSFTVAPEANSFLCAEIISEKDVQPGNNKQCIKSDHGDYYFSPYPNPTAGPVQVDWIAIVAGTSRIIIHDSMGRKVYDWQTPSIAGLNRATLDLSLFQTGLYYVTIETGQSKKTTSLLLQ